LIKSFAISPFFHQTPTIVTHLSQLPFKTIATHTLALGVGLGLCWFLGGTAEESATKPNPRPTRKTSTHTTSSPRTSITSRLAELIKDENTPYIFNQKTANEEDQKELQRLLTLAQQYRHISDLNSSITEALIAGDEDACEAIFLEWYRRDPAAAFDALALRKPWMYTLDYSLALHLNSSDLIDQINNPARNDQFKSNLSYMLGYKCATNDDLHVFIHSYKSLQKNQRKDFISIFAGKWTPENPQEAARIISQEMPVGLRDIILKYDDDPFSYYYSTLNKDLAIALLAENMEVSEEVQQQLIKASQQEESPNTASPPTSDQSQATIKPGLEPKNSVYELTQILDRQLYHDFDYPELFANGELTVDEITHAMQQQIEGSRGYSEELKRAVFLSLAPYSPEISTTWAQANISPKALQKDTLTIITSSYSSIIYQDPRLSQKIKLVSLFEPTLQGNDEGKGILLSYRSQMEAWSMLAPEAAEASTQQLSPSHPIWKYELPDNPPEEPNLLPTL